MISKGVGFYSRLGLYSSRNGIQYEDLSETHDGKFEDNMLTTTCREFILAKCTRSPLLIPWGLTKFPRLEVVNALWGIPSYKTKTMKKVQVLKKDFNRTKFLNHTICLFLISMLRDNCWWYYEVGARSYEYTGKSNALFCLWADNHKDLKTPAIQ